MKVITIIFLIAITMVSSITLIMKSIAYEEREEAPLAFTSEELSANKENDIFIPPTRVGRFLVENKKPRVADHCNKDKEICYKQGGYNSTCCNNKCVDLWDDVDNCGACKNKCKSAEACCSGNCVNLSYDLMNCKSCGNKCSYGLLCVYGMCDYA